MLREGTQNFFYSFFFFQIFLILLSATVNLVLLFWYFYMEHFKIDQSAFKYVLPQKRTRDHTRM